MAAVAWKEGKKERDGSEMELRERQKRRSRGGKIWKRKVDGGGED